MSRVVLLSSAVAVIAAAVALKHPSSGEAWRDALFQNAIAAAERADVSKPRLVLVRGSLLASAISAWPWGRDADTAAVAAASTRLRGADAIHVEGILYLIRGESGVAAQRLRAAVSIDSRAAWWTDLAAAEIAAGDASADPEHHLAALEATDRAIALDPQLAQAHCNRALAIERLGYERTALAEWRTCASADPSSAWQAAIRKHVAAVSHKQTAREQWAEAQKRIASISSAELEHLIDAYPLEARLWGETVFAGEWAKRLLAHDASPDMYLHRAREIGKRLASRSGERMLSDAVAVIEKAIASTDRRRVEDLARAYITYVNGRQAFRNGALDEATRDFTDARRAFATAGSPMQDVAAHYQIKTEIQKGQMVTASTMLARLSERQPSSSGYLALIAEREYLTALCDGMQGRWGDALATATSSRDAFERLGERGTAAESEKLIGDLMTFLGQPRRAWSHYARASRIFSDTGLWQQLQVCAGMMCQVEMRRHRWLTARAASAIEVALGGDSETLGYALLRNASAAWQAGDEAAARSSLLAARAKAAGIENAGAKETLLADIGAIEGRMLAASNPAAGIARLSQSIDFQTRAGRAFALPELFLDRGRVRLALGASAAALNDFEMGLRSLESQRNRVYEHELRAGIFDDVRVLFGEAAAASLREGDQRKAFEYIERGRARAILDALADEARPRRFTTVAAVQRSLSPGTLLVSYAFLADRVAIFAMDRARLDVRFSSVRAEAVIRDANALVAAMKEHRDVFMPAAGLYDALLLPISDRIDRASRLVFVRDTALEQVPFAALVDRRTGRYLVQSHDTLVAPSAGVFMASGSKGESLRPRSVAVFANPAIPKNESLPFLTAAGREAGPIARRYARSLVLRRELATTAKFRNEAARYDVVQFSGHTQIDSAEPWKSALLFEAPLTARDISAMHFSGTKLVILGACSTLAPDREHVEGTSPIASAFLIAGVPAVIGSLWDVDDEDAAAVMVPLHEQLSRGHPPAAALCAVQRALIVKSHRHPADWAAFTAMGHE